MIGWHTRFIFDRKRKADKLGETFVFEDFATELWFSLLASVVLAHSDCRGGGGHRLC